MLQLCNLEETKKHAANLNSEIVLIHAFLTCGISIKFKKKMETLLFVIYIFVVTDAALKFNWIFKIILIKNNNNKTETEIFANSVLCFEI